MTTYRPADVAERLGVSSATLRRWSQQFGGFLSAAAVSSTDEASSKHRRYTDEDLAVLERAQRLLKEGLSYDEVRDRLRETAPAQGEPVSAEEDAILDQNLAMVLPTGKDNGVANIAQLMSETLLSLSDSHQIILSGQGTVRQLLGVLLQDNFNLKEENTQLRERMLETERKLFEMKRDVDEGQLRDRERMRQMESYLFEMQRRLDSLAERSLVRQTPSAPPPSAPAAPKTTRPAPAVAVVPATPAPAASPPPVPIAPIDSGTGPLSCSSPANVGSDPARPCPRTGCASSGRAARRACYTFPRSL